MKRYFGVFISSLIHLFVGVILFYLFQPIVRWYLHKIPALGIDLYNSVTPVSFHQKHFSFWFNGFKDIWYGGHPFVHDFPQFHYYFMIPFANAFGLVRGIQIYAMFTLFLLVFFSYLLFYRLSKNYGISLFLALLILLSPSLYGSATWGGSLPYFGTQLFFPLSLFLMVTYIKTTSMRWFWASALSTGIGFLFHPLSIAAFLFPSMAVLVLFSKPIHFSLQGIMHRIGKVLAFFIAVFFTAFSLLYDFVQTKVNVFISGLSVKNAAVSNVSSAISDTPLDTQIAQFYKNQIATLYTDTNHYLFWMVGLGFIVFVFSLVLKIIFKRNNKELLLFFSVFLICGYVVAHVYLNFTGRPFLSQGLYRAFWPFPIVLGIVASYLWGSIFSFYTNQQGKKALAFNSIVIVISLVTSILFGLFAVQTFTQELPKVLQVVESKSDFSSAYPEVLSMKLEEKDQEILKKQLLPSFINPNDKNKRMYESDATVNIWWNSFYETPLARGYIDPPIGNDRRGGFFLLDIAINNDTLVREFKFKEEMAKNYALFLMDWYAVNYFEGGRLSLASSVPPSSYLLQGDVFDTKEEVSVNGAIHRIGTKSGKPEPRFDLKQSLIYYKVKDEHASQVLSATDAPAILVISDDPGYEQIWRVLAAENLNSKYVVPVQGGKFADDFSKSDLEYFDAVILHNYSYNNKDKAFNTLSEFAQNGGTVFIDTGGEIKDANSNDLAELFPFTKSERKEMKGEWEFEAVPHPLTDQIDFSQFGPPVFNKNGWKVTAPSAGSEMREDTKVVLKAQGKPIVIEREYGDGKIIWSGMNFAYHFNQYPIIEEGKFFKNILSALIDIKRNEVIVVDADWKKPEHIVAKSDSKTRGLLLKEQYYPGWNIKVEGSNTNSKLFRTGPTYPGFMYVAFKDPHPDKYSVEFTYNGEIGDWVVTFINLLALMVLLDLILFNGKVIISRFKFLYPKVRKRLSSWWSKEEDD